jgi:hypothetical protein
MRSRRASRLTISALLDDGVSHHDIAQVGPTPSATPAPKRAPGGARTEKNSGAKSECYSHIGQPLLQRMKAPREGGVRGGRFRAATPACCSCRRVRRAAGPGPAVSCSPASASQFATSLAAAAVAHIVCTARRPARGSDHRHLADQETGRVARPDVSRAPACIGTRIASGGTKRIDMVTLERQANLDGQIRAALLLAGVVQLRPDARRCSPHRSQTLFAPQEYLELVSSG